MERIILMVALMLGLGIFGQASDLKLGDPAPVLKLKTDEGASFDLNSRKGQWTVLYFYPKADTPGCTKQACAFRDNISQIRKLGAELFGVSADSVEALYSCKCRLFAPLANRNASCFSPSGSTLTSSNRSATPSSLHHPKASTPHFQIPPQGTRPALPIRLAVPQGGVPGGRRRPFRPAGRRPVCPELRRQPESLSLSTPLPASRRGRPHSYSRFLLRRPAADQKGRGEELPGFGTLFSSPFLPVVFLIYRKILAFNCTRREFRDISSPTHAILPLPGKTKLLSTSKIIEGAIQWDQVKLQYQRELDS